jgi:hypothetical protein
LAAARRDGVTVASGKSFATIALVTCPGMANWVVSWSDMCIASLQNDAIFTKTKGFVMAIAKVEPTKTPARETNGHANGNGFEELYRRQRLELDKLIDQRVEPFRKKIRELEAKRAEVNEELKHLYMVVGGYEQGLKNGEM